MFAAGVAQIGGIDHQGGNPAPPREYLIIEVGCASPDVITAFVHAAKLSKKAQYVIHIQICFVFLFNRFV